MGESPTQVTLHIVLPTAMPGILTGVMLAIARAAGETAPLLFTAMFSSYWLTRDVMEPTPSLGDCSAGYPLLAATTLHGAGCFGTRPSRTSITSRTTQLMFSIAVCVRA